MTAPRPLRSLYGYGDRPQEILTPQTVLDMLPWPVELDPCACKGSLVPARVRYFGPPHDEGGLILPWMDRTYCNPPYNELKHWLLKAELEEAEGHRSVVLAPVRTHRVWFRAAMDAADRVKWLDPVEFVGHTQPFPAPVCLFYFGRS